MPIAKALIDVVGIEIESAFMTQDQAINLVQNNDVLYGWKVHNDSSINSTRGRINNSRISVLPVNDQSKLIQNNNYGAEIVSPPTDTLESNNWIDGLKIILGEVERRKEIPQNTTSIHVHINSAGIPLFVAQNLLKLWVGLEASIYRLGIAEKGDHRGKFREDYKYCRPMSNPHTVISDKCLRYSFSTEQMLKARTYAEFFKAYGNVNLSREANKYHPARYCGLNFFPLQSINTIEFRVFNMTSDYRNVIAWVKLCQQMMRQSMGKPIELNPQPLGSTPDFNIPLLQSILELDDETCIQLEHLWNISNWCSPVRGNLFTHSNHNKIIWDNKFAPPEVDEAYNYTLLDNGEYKENLVTYAKLTGDNPRRPRFTTERLYNPIPPITLGESFDPETDEDLENEDIDDDDDEDDDE